jgi:hypothetical protein
MRMADGGYRPAYNVQISGDLDSDVIVGWMSTPPAATGTEGACRRQVGRRYDHKPKRWLADGSFTVLADIAAVAHKGIAVFCPLKPGRNPDIDLATALRRSARGRRMAPPHGRRCGRSLRKL